jgi:hypothetical protein
VSCDDFNYFNETICKAIVQDTPICLDALQLAEEQPTASNGLQASELCQRASPWVNDTSGINPYDSRLNVRINLSRLQCVSETDRPCVTQCSINDMLDCFPEIQWVKQVMNDTRLRDAVSAVTIKLMTTELVERSLGFPMTFHIRPWP